MHRTGSIGRIERVRLPWSMRSCRSRSIRASRVQVRERVRVSRRDAHPEVSTPFLFTRSLSRGPNARSAGGSNRCSAGSTP